MNKIKKANKRWQIANDSTEKEQKWPDFILGGIIKIMFLQWILVKLLADYIENHRGCGLTREELLSYALRSRRLLLYRDIPYLRNNDRFQTRVNFILGDCIRGETGYMSEADDGVTLLVTPLGRRFISFWFLGLIEELAKSYPRAIGIIFTSGIVWFIINHFYHWFIAKFLI